MKVLALSLALCGFCFAQDDPQGAGAAIHQFSNGTCSVNLADVHGNVNISFSGPACNGLSERFENLLNQVGERLERRFESLEKKLNGYSMGLASLDLWAPSSVPGIGVRPANWIIAGVPAGGSAFDLSSITRPNSTLAGITTISGATYDSLSATITKPVSFGLILGADMAQSKSLIELTPAGHVAFGGGSTITGATYDSLSATITKPVGFGSILGTDLAQSKTPFELVSDGHIIGVQPLAGLTVGGASTVGNAYDSLSFTFTKSVSASSILGADLAQSKSLIELTPAGHVAFGGGSTITGATYDPLSATITKPVGFGSILGTDLARSKTPFELASDGHIIGVQPLAGLTVGGASTVGNAYDSLSFTFTNPVGFGSILGAGLVQSKTPFELASDGHIIGVQPLAGLDYQSLSKSLSDLTSRGDIITGWTLAYKRSPSPSLPSGLLW